MSVIIVTALLLAVDAFFIGVSLGLERGFRRKHLVLINAIIFAMCVVVFFVAVRLREYIRFDTSILVGCVFIVLGLIGVLSRGDGKRDGMGLRRVLVLGLVMSVDAMVGTVALATTQAPTFWIPVIIGATHLVYTMVGSSLAGRIRIPARASGKIAGACLMLVGLLNFFV
jgi:putative Mn2+ efflux pump MntP